MKKEILEWIVCVFFAITVALLFRYYVAIPTVVKQSSMSPTLEENQKLIINRTIRISKNVPKIGDIITFEAPSNIYSLDNYNQNNPIALYEKNKTGIFNKFLYNVLELSKKSYIKRLIALEGQHVVIENGKVIIDNVELDEYYLSKSIKTESTIFNDFIVPDGYVFAMGDNRENSIDCRHFGCIPLDKIDGIVAYKF